MRYFFVFEIVVVVVEFLVGFFNRIQVLSHAFFFFIAAVVVIFTGRLLIVFNLFVVFFIYFYFVLFLFFFCSCLFRTKSFYSYQLRVYGMCVCKRRVSSVNGVSLWKKQKR